MSTATANGKLETNDPTVLPLSPSETGSDGDSKGHGADGRFIPGNKCSKGNPFARRMAALRSAALEELTADDVRALMRRLHAQALVGDVASAALLLRYTLGRPPEGVDPDMLDVDEWRKLAAMPSYTEMVIASTDGVRTDKAIQDIRALKEVKPGGTREEHCLSGRDIIEERRAKRRYRRP
jgi:hypothetical protein